MSSADFTIYTPGIETLSYMHGENSAHFLQLMPHTILQVLFYQLPITAGWAEAVFNEKFANLYTWPTVGIETQTFWSWVQHVPTHWVKCNYAP